MNIYFFGLISFAFGVVLITILVLMRRVDKISLMFAFFSASVCGWAICASIWMTQIYSYHTTLKLIRISHAFSALIPITWVHFICFFINKKIRYGKIFYIANYTFAVFLIAMSTTDFYIQGLHSILTFKYYTSPGPLFHIHALIYCCLVGYGFYLLFQAYRHAVGQIRNQLRFLLLGTAIGFLSGSTPFFPTYDIPVPMECLLLLPLFPVFTGIALIKYGLFDPQSIAAAFHKEKLAALGVLTASMNHEVRNPLYIIQGLAESYLSRLEEGRPMETDYPREVLGKIRAQAQRAADTVKRFALFAKERVDQEVRFEPLNFEKVLDEVMMLAGSELAMDKVGVVRDIPKDLAPVWADRRLLEEILLNLIMNACQAMAGIAGHSGKGGGQLRLRARNAERGIRIEIEDNGPGMTQEMMRNIFQPFYTTKEQGTGLGLYITKQLIDKNRGCIRVESAVGKGTKFILELERG